MFHISNVRLVWQSMLREGYNFSLPYVQIVSIRSQNSRYGYAIVVETSKNSNSMLLGFRLDSEAKAKEVTKELRRIWKTACQRPFFGLRIAETIESVTQIMYLL